MTSPSPLPPTPYKIHHCHSPQLGPIGLCITPPFLYIHQYAAPEGLRLAAIPWAQVRKLAKVTAKFASIPTLVIWFYRGRLPETMVRLMVDDHRLVVTFLASSGGGPGRSIETLLQEMIHTGGLVKIRRFWDVHYEPPTRGPSVNVGTSRNYLDYYQINEEHFDDDHQ